MVTNRGSIIPCLIIFTILPVTTLRPLPLLFGNSYSNIPALSNIVLKGALIASSNTSSPADLAAIFCEAFNSAIPPPGTIPSFIAALVAHIASSTRSVFSFNSISELAPTLTTAILADNLANLFSKRITAPGFCVVDKSSLICSMISRISSDES